MTLAEDAEESPSTRVGFQAEIGERRAHFAAWLRIWGYGNDHLLQYADALVREFGDVQQMALCLETAVPGASILARLSSVVYDAIGMKKAGHNFLLVRGVLEVAKTM